MGDIGLWEVGSRERLVLKNFKVWDIGACSMPLQVYTTLSPHVTNSILYMLQSINVCTEKSHIGADSNGNQAALAKDPVVSVNRIIWGPDGTLFGKFLSFKKCQPQFLLFYMKNIVKIN